uniref:DNA polymerase zeta catalytic subunit n=1 Tax=Takifugu rubripes TaxID=31033 RepID=H2S107_TAKRU
MFAVRVVTADYYLASPVKDLDVCYSEFRESNVKKVPVVRIFGATPAGQKTCLHLHGIFPYIYVPYDGYNQQPERYMRLVAFSIDRALNVTMGNPSSSAQHIFKVALVSGMPFYGYHAKEKLFMKIYLYNPQMVKRVCDLLQSGAVMNKSYQPHEGHIPYLLQLFIDYNLYGMNLLNLAAVKFRRGRKIGMNPFKTPCTSKVNDSILGGTFVRWEESTLPCSLVLDEVEKQSTCELEVDAVAADILNRIEIQNQIGRNPGLQAIWEDEKHRRRENNQGSQIDTPDSQDRGFVPVTASENIFMNRVKEILKENEFDMTQSFSVGDGEDQEDLLDELTLHPDSLTPERLLCTPANVVEVHRDLQTGEENILWLHERRTTFVQDHTIIDLLAGLEDDGFCKTPIRQNSQSQSFSGAGSYRCNSDEEEAGPELEKEEAELSFLMSQQWDNEPENFSSIRQVIAAYGFSDEQQESSDDDMDWSGNNSLFANLSIPQVDGAADDSNGKFLSSFISSECSTGLEVHKKIPYIPPVKHPIHPEVSPISMDKEDLRTLYTYDKKTSISLDNTNLESFTFSKRKVTKNRKKYGSIENVETNCLSILQNHRTFSLCYSELRNGSAKTELEISQKESSGPVLKNNSSPSPIEEDEFLDRQNTGMAKDSEEGDIGELKIRYEDYQENKTEMTVVAQQEAHYKFFPSVILSNCLTRKKVVNKKLGDPDGGIGLGHARRSGPKINKKKLGMVGPRNKSSTVESSICNTHADPDLIKSKQPDTTMSISSEKGKDFGEDLSNPLRELRAKVTCMKHLALPGSKYTLRAKRKMAYDKEDGLHSGATLSKNPVCHRERLKDKITPKGQEIKFTKRRKKEPPVIIKYIIINRFKGQKNMLVKISKVNTEEQMVMLTPDRIDQYNKLAPLKDFWPKVPESTAVRVPTPEYKAKKHKRKTKVNTTNKKTICTSSKPQARQGQRVKRTKKCQKDVVLPSLQPPQPCYCKHADDHGKEYTDVMIELGYLSDRSPSPADSTPPRCWSPSESIMEARSSKQLIDPLSDPYLNSACQRKYSNSSKAAPKLNKHSETKNGARRSIKVNQLSEKVGHIKERMKQCRSVAPMQKMKAKDTVECMVSSSAIMPKQRRPRKKKNPNSTIDAFSEDTSQHLFTEDELPPSDGSSQTFRSFQHPVNSNQCGLKTVSSIDSSIEPKAGDCETSIMKVSHNLSVLAQLKQQACQTTVVKIEALQDGRASPLPVDTSLVENDKEVKPRAASLPNNGDMSAFSDTLSGLAVLKQLLQKRQQGQALPLQTVGTNTHSPINVQTTVLSDSTAKATRSRKATSSILKDKKKQNTERQDKPHSAKPNNPGMDCLIEDSLSPELPNSYNFDINAVDQTEFSSPYSGNQFVLTDKNLPVKFLSDVSQEQVSAAQHLDFEKKLDKLLGCGEELHKERPISPDLFERPENVDFVSNHLTFLDSEKAKRKKWDWASSKAHMLSPFQDFHCEKKELLFSVIDPVMPLRISSSFDEHGGSPIGELPEGMDGLISTTPSSSPCSISSLSQVRASHLQRGTGSATHILKPLMSPPTRDEILCTLLDLEMSEATFQEPFCSNPSDAPEKPKEVGGRKLMVSTRLVKELEEFNGELSLEGLHFWKTVFSAMTHPAATVTSSSQVQLAGNSEATKKIASAGDKKVILLPCRNPPSRKHLELWLEAQKQYERLHNVRKEEKGLRLNVEVNPEGRELKKVPCEGLSNIKGQKGHNMSFVISPMRNTISPYPACRRLQQRRSQTDPLKRVLLTTQMKNQFAALNLPKKDNSQIEGPSISNTYGFKISMRNLQDAKALHEVQHLTLMGMELHARTRRDLEPDPEFDPICALFYCISSDASLPDTIGTQLTGAIVINGDHQGPRRAAPLLVRSGVSGLQVTYVTNEKELFQELVTIMRRFDPDILVGYEVQMRSWGYLVQRAAVLGVGLCQQLSRVPGDNSENRFAADQDEYGADTMTEIHIVGRITLNLWRVMKTEAILRQYMKPNENVAFHVLHQRFPLYSQRTLSDWFDHNSDLFRWKMVDCYISRVQGIMQLLQEQDIIGRTSELARVFGIQFFHVLTRGSQYRVESMMLRVAKPLNYIPVTPSVQQRAHQRAPQCLPLVMEPESRFYSNSVVVLDFQSLYPSIIIAYNYCFSTCLGHVDSLGTPDEFKFGCTSLRVPHDLLYQLRNDITVSPNGIAFVKASVRKGILPSMLEEILNTRIMVKQSMKMYKQDKTLMRLLDARQLGLKLIANVTFGYTAANYSGRMPSVEVGDSIVHKARETLERAIKLVNDTTKWGARVVYGDTDSMFVLLKGATKEQAFKIGLEIAEAVTATNPKPVKLKFEKVYLPCVLQTKKRYVGYMYESLDQKEPVFDAKGIETVRRDSCPAVSKILERSIKLLFETRDISQVKQYVQRQCIKVLDGRASMQDLTFAKEYRGSSSYRPGACVPALELTRRMMAHDRRSEPRVGERVPYVIVCGTPGVALIQLVRQPVEVLQDATLRLNTTYYLTKQILPPLGRMFQLIGVDVFSWYKELPKIQKVSCSSVAYWEEGRRKGTISQYFTTLHCPACDELTQLGVCSHCRAEPQRVAVTLHQEMRQWESQQELILQICRNCSGSAERLVPCVSLDCPVLYKLSRVSRQLSKAPYLRQLLEQF